MISTPIFRCGLFITIILAIPTFISCFKCISCRCGSSNKNYTYCIKNESIENFTCQNWAQCQSCKDNSTYCLSCPPKRYGHFCTEDKRSNSIKMTRRKRQSRSGFFCTLFEIDVTGMVLEPNFGDNRERVFQPGTKLKFDCKEGYEIEGEIWIIYCKRNGEWTSKPPKCKIDPTYKDAPTVFCNYPGIVENGMVEDDIDAKIVGQTQAYAPGAELRYECKAGYEIVGSKSLICTLEGEWSDDPPLCRETPTTTVGRNYETTCENEGPILNGRLYVHNTRDVVNGLEFPLGTKLFYLCSKGYFLQGTAHQICENTGYWSDEKPTCIEENVQNSDKVVCPYPVVDPDLIMESIPPNDPRRKEHGFRIESLVRFRCRTDPHFDNFIFCLSNGQWDKDPSPCRRSYDSCPDLIPIENGFVIVYKAQNPSDDFETYRKFPIGTYFIYRCFSQYSLVGEAELFCQSGGRWSADKPKCIKECGGFGLQSAIKIGEDGNLQGDKAPWIVKIHLKETGSICGGVVLDHTTVLTVAHCFEEDNHATLYFGKYSRLRVNDDADTIIRNSSLLLIHPKFNESTFDNDIAIVKFYPGVPFSEKIQPVCMPTPNSTAAHIVPGQTGFAIGIWLTKDEIPSKELLVAPVPIQASETCVEAYQRRKIGINITVNMFCSGLADEENSICRGASGYPLFFYDRDIGRFILEGLISHGTSGVCYKPERYTMFTRVSNYLQWILQNKKQ